MSAPRYIDDPTEAKTTYAYDDKGNMTTQHYADGRVREIQYDRDSALPLMETRADGQMLFYAYTPKGQIETVGSDDQVLHFAYDDFDRVTEANTQTHTLSYGYDHTSERTEETQDGITLHKERTPSAPITTLSFLSHTQSITRDIPHRETHIEVEGKRITLRYDPKARTQRTLYPNGLVEEVHFSTTGELTALSTAKATYHYDRDILGRITQITAASAEGNTSQTAYRYDAKGQLIGAGKSTFGYDTAGNPQHDNASYDPKNHRLLEDSLYTYSYDDNGNLITKQNRQSGESTTYGWNSFGQLINVRTATQTLRYSYDALGRRVSKQTDDTIHHYLYDGQHIVAILDTDKQLLATITHHPSQVDTPLSITNHQTKRTYYYHRDHQGSIIALSNEAGEIVESFIYDGHYGKILNHYSTEETMNPYGYTGREIELPDLYYYRARYYDPGMQRFISVDPIEFESEDYHWYRYVGNDPVNRTDPTGLFDPVADAIMRPVGHPLPGSSELDFKLYGNWCGPGWTGGYFHKTWNDLTLLQRKNATKPINAADTCCKQHDISYGKCRDQNPCNKKERAQCMKRADRRLSKCVRTTRQWWHPRVIAINQYMYRSNPDGGQDPESCKICKKNSPH